MRAYGVKLQRIIAIFGVDNLLHLMGSIIHPYHHALNAEVANEVVGTTTGNWVVPVPSQHLVDT